MFLSFPSHFSALLLSRNVVRLLFACLLSSRCASRGLCIDTATTKGIPNTQQSVSITTDRILEEPCEVTSLMHGFEAERRGRPLRLGSGYGSGIATATTPDDG